ncbi:hypothetical protein CC77DRAFT_1015330 [Alternaria alternata]|uniref:Uncharacterized protein n=1 Tax=Alternaria alternata TaxID=5599 RepID=A0A177E460_ALTAL|nr:hypothetical protein CC77DRAFT_1015330 [Alternaria alternata]OAG25992.1 hypothetical protein CC77DRAFT_1015330 [Alternaria alternata]
MLTSWNGRHRPIRIPLIAAYLPSLNITEQRATSVPRTAVTIAMLTMGSSILLLYACAYMRRLRTKFTWGSDIRVTQ